MSHHLLAMAGIGLVAAASAEAAPALPAFWKSSVAEMDAAAAAAKKGRVRVLARSPGGRKLFLVAYGARERLASSANYGSACGGQDPASYRRKDGRQKPVVLFLGPVHGQEVEGMAGMANLLAVAETGRDLRGREWPDLVANLGRCRVLVVPLSNPDGRARCPDACWVGKTLHELERAGMGTQPNGANYTWPTVKRIHPMRGEAARQLGGYFNDAGVNLMHDDWLRPMAPETRAFLDLARDEAPDFIVSLHSHCSLPSVEPTAYVPRTAKETIRAFADRLYARYRTAGLPATETGPEPKEDGAAFPPPSFNLSSALHHACGAVSFVYECPHGVSDEAYVHVTPEQILDLQMLLYDELLRFAVEHPVRWVREE